MRSRRTEAALRDIRHNIGLATQFVAELDCEAFAKDARTVYAVIRCLEIISEASRRLPETLKDEHPEIAWRDMAAAGNVYRHSYEDVTPDVVWETVERALPALLRAVDQELSPPDS